MRKFTVVLSLILMAAPLARAASLAGRVIVIEGDGVKQVDVPVSLPCDAGGNVVALDEKTGKEFPATLRDGELVILVKAGAAQNLILREKKAGKSAVELRPGTEDGVIDVYIDGKHFTSYHYGGEHMKPFLWPVLGAGGVGITRDWPMGEGVEGYKQDHPHHKSFYTAHGIVNDADTWLENKEAGVERVKKATWGSGDAYGWIRSENVWQNGDGKAVVDETREYRFYATPASRRLVDVTITFAANHGDVKFGDTKEGGLISIRMRPELSHDNANITNALGDKGEKNTWGKPSPWCDYSGELDDVGWRGIAVFDHPSNLRHPTSWHVRNYGLMGANCFGYSYFNAKDYNKPLLPSTNGDYTLKNGETLTFRYRVYIHSGDVEDANVAGQYAGFATPPKARWK